MNTGLVLQGGGLRGIYTAGVLDFFIEHDIQFPYVIAVSAGALNASAYLAKVMGFGRLMYTNYLKDPSWFGVQNWIKERSFIGMNTIFKEVPRLLQSKSFQGLHESSECFVVGTTDCHTGRSVYFSKDQCSDIFTAIKASCSLPFLTKIVNFEDKALLDGGIADPIPIRKSIEDGNTKHVIIQTSFPSPSRFNATFIKWGMQCIYPKYPRLIEALIKHHALFIQTDQYIKQLEYENKAFVIRPTVSLPLKRWDTNERALSNLYEQGYRDSERLQYNLLNWLNQP
jgi:predicted patatin/cPLA2 family phospholipase